MRCEHGTENCPGVGEKHWCAADGAEPSMLVVAPPPGLAIFDEPEILTVEEGAAFLRISRTALYDAIGRGEVPHRRIGRQIRLHRSALVRWLSGDRAEHQK